MQRILICGGRHVPDNDERIYNEFSKIVDSHITDWTPEDDYGNTLPIVTIVHGGARGVDSIADQYAVVNWLQFEEYKADWKTHGKKAGFIRNQQMIDTNPDLVLAFNPGNGTRDTIRRAKKAGIPVFVYEIPLDKAT